MPNWRPFELLPYLFLTRWMMRTSSLHLFTIVCCLCVCVCVLQVAPCEQRYMLMLTHTSVHFRRYAGATHASPRAHNIHTSNAMRSYIVLRVAPRTLLAAPRRYCSTVLSIQFLSRRPSVRKKWPPVTFATIVFLFVVYCARSRSCSSNAQCDQWSTVEK